MNNRFPDTPHEPDAETFVNSASGKPSTCPSPIGPWDKTRLDDQGTKQQLSKSLEVSQADDTLAPPVAPPANSPGQRNLELEIESAKLESVKLEPSKAKGRLPFRSTYLSGLNLSGLRLTNLSRLLLDHSQLLREDGKGLKLLGVGHGIMAGVAVLASGLTWLNPPWIQALEYEVQTFFFQRRGAVSPPQDIVILEIDETSLAQGDFYREDPKTYANFAPLQQWPWQRQAYAIAIDRVMGAGAKAVAIDLILDRPSVWGDEDDDFLQYVLERYPEQVILASSFDDSENDSGETLQIAPPLSRLLDAGGKPGVINYPIAPNDRIHQFSQVWLQAQADGDVAMQTYLKGLPESWTQTFVEQTVLATLRRRNPEINQLQFKGDQIFFYGRAGTFEREAFWTLLDPQNWEVHQLNHTFRDKIVLIGPTAELFQDEHRTPFGFMAGIRNPCQCHCYLP